MNSRKKIKNIMGIAMGAFFLLSTFSSQAASALPQEVLGTQIQQQAQLDFAGGVMTTALQASLRGEAIEPISGEIIDVIQRNGGYKQLSNFVLAVTMLEGETGLMLSHLTSNMTNSLSPGSGAAVTGQGWGGFGEYGFFALSGFLFVMWAAGWVIMSHGSPTENMAEETFTAYQEAA